MSDEKFAVFEGGKPAEVISEEIFQRMLKLIYEYEGIVAVTIVIGVMEIAKEKLIRDARYG